MATRAKRTTKPVQSPTAAVNAQLALYRDMRDFSTTTEPRGKSKGSPPLDALPFVIQKHAATRLHYDFRLGWHGVLKSWAVAKGPSYVVADKRLAVQVEDHPMEYGGFEGTIPKGQYGGGTVMLWDTGTWEPVGDADEGLRTGRLKFILHGQKLKGHWMLVRMGGRAAQESKPNWLLIKEHDEYERSANAHAIVDEAPNSVVTQRDLTAIDSDADHVWDSRTGLAADERAKQERSQQKTSSKPKKVAAPKKTKRITVPDGAKSEKLPAFVLPQLASVADRPPQSLDWLHELKLDGYRMQARIQDGDVQLLTRSGLDWTNRMGTLATALKTLPAGTALLDGEVVALDERGISSFAALQAAFQKGATHTLYYYVFDLLHLDGYSLRSLPLLDRKEMLARLIGGLDDSIRVSDHVRDAKGAIYDEACRHGAEGVVSKRSDSVYTSGRSASWLKAKCGLRQEFVIGGFTLQKNGKSLGALLLGYYQDGKLIYAGRTGTGFTQQSQMQIRERLEPIRTTANPFLAVGTAERRGAHWVKAQLVAEVAFSTWTADNLVRQAAFKGLREDKPAKDVVRENVLVDTPTPASKMPAQKSGRRTAPISYASPSSLPRLTHPDKVLDKESGLTKQQLAAYYAEVADHMLPHIADRPLSLVRCPSGTAAKCFFQKHANQGLPAGLGSVDIADRKGGKPEPYIVLSEARLIPELAQLNVLELHPWGAPASDFEHPDRIIFDLDPDASIDWRTLANAALAVRARLKKLGLESFLKSTGGKGLHIVAPIEPDHDWPAIKTFAHRCVLAMETEEPKLYITKMTKAARSGRIYLDYLRNERGATAVAPYSPRSRSGVPVSVPMAWNELRESAAPRCLAANIADWRKRLKRDLWSGMVKTRQRLTAKAIATVSSDTRLP